MTKDIEAIQDLYGTKGYIDVTTSSRNLRVVKIPNIDTGTIDLVFKIEEAKNEIEG
jgi:outer membrane protein assembly factor BamA